MNWRLVALVGVGLWTVPLVCMGMSQSLWSHGYGVSFSPDAERLLLAAVEARNEDVCGSGADARCRALVAEEAVAALVKYLGESGLGSGGEAVVGASELEGFRLEMRSYGKLKLSSTPSEAKVYLDTNEEGVTTMNRIYPTGAYTFVLKKDGCDDKSVPVSIQADETNDTNVPMECSG